MTRPSRGSSNRQDVWFWSKKRGFDSFPPSRSTPGDVRRERRRVAAAGTDEHPPPRKRVAVGGPRHPNTRTARDEEVHAVEGAVVRCPEGHGMCVGVFDHHVTGL